MPEEDEGDDSTLSPLYEKMHDRLCAIEALLANLYSKYYHEQYSIPSKETKRSLRNIRHKEYSIYSNYSFIDKGHACRVEEIIDHFFSNLDSIVSMSNVIKNDQNFPVTLGTGYNEFDCDNPAFRAQIQSLLKEEVAKYADLTIDHIYQVKPSSDLVLRVWLKDPKSQKPVHSLIVKMLGGNAVRNDIATKYGLFYREAAFYSFFAGPIKEFSPVCHYASPDDSILILEDLGQAVMGDQLYGYQAEEALSVTSTIIEFHKFWLNKEPDCFLPKVNDPEIIAILPEMLAHSWAVTKQHLNPQQSSKVDAIIEDLITNLKPISDELSVNSTIIHGDLRMENLLFNKMELDSIIDWQLLAIGSPMIDIAYFLVQSGCSEERKQIKDEVLHTYRQTFDCYKMAPERLHLEYDLATKYSLIIPIMGAAWDLQEIDKPRDIVLSAFHRTIEAIS